MPLLLQTPAPDLPLTLGQVRVHLRLAADYTLEDDLLSAYIAAATQECEHKMRRAIMPQQWAWVGPVLAAQTELRLPPVTAINSVSVEGPDGTVATLDPAAYRLLPVSAYLEVCQLNEAAPASSGAPDAARIVFTTGYATPLLVPSAIRSWLLLRVGSLYENREAIAIATGQLVDLSFDSLLDRYRQWGF